ncbi:MAG: alpha/beta fold hydrolase [Pseudomonadota bacterium]
MILENNWRRLLTGRRLGAVILLTAAASGAIAQQAIAPTPIESFFENNAFGGAVLSPTGRHLAVRTGLKGRRDVLAVIDLDNSSGKAVAEYSDADIGEFQWVNDDRLVYNLRDSRQASGDMDEGPGLYAVNRDGTERLQLADRTHRRVSPQPWNTFLLDQIGGQDSDWIYVQRPMYDRWDKYYGTRLRRLNTRTGKSEVASEPDVEVSGFMLDFKGEPGLAYLSNAIKNKIFYRDPATDKWRELASYATYTGSRDMIKPLGFGPDGSLFVVANAGQDTSTLRSFDFAAGKVSADEIVVTKGYDFDGSLVTSDKILGVRLTTDATSNIWFDPAMKEIQRAVDLAFPATVNLLTVPARPGSTRVLVESYSDVQPSQFALYDTKTGLINRVGSAYPKIDSARMARQEPLSYKSRDGLTIPGLLTLPPGGVRKNLPMVVLIHGGPWVRGASWGWDPETQFLASRGYAVLEVEFRGSTGLGVAHFEASFKQWGLAMQHDIADGTRWAIEQGIADPKRICIAGSSYGGYATLMGLVNDPDLYRCGFEWLGVTDIELMYTGTWFTKSDLDEGTLRYGMPVMIGDVVKDAAQLKATSPIQQAARIRQPLLLAYGAEDKRVPLFHGKKFYSAVTRTNKQVEFVDYSGEGHGWSLPKNRIDFWQRVEKFLDKHIGSGSLRVPASQDTN